MSRKMTKAYKIKRQASGEYKVNCFIDGIHNEAASYYTDDRADALATIETNIKRDKEIESLEAYDKANLEASFNGSPVYEDDMVYFINCFAGRMGKTPGEYLARLGKLVALHNTQLAMDLCAECEGGN
jgi:hypothetical protein